MRRPNELIWTYNLDVSVDPKGCGLIRGKAIVIRLSKSMCSIPTKKCGNSDMGDDDCMQYSDIAFKKPSGSRSYCGHRKTCIRD